MSLKGPKASDFQMTTVISRKFSVEYYEYFSDYLIIIMNWLTINVHT